MRRFYFLNLLIAMTFLTGTLAFVSCVDDNIDTEAPFLEVTPKTLVFSTNGTPVEGSHSSFNISTNRPWKATVKDDKSWVTLSATQGDGSATIQVSIPENITDQASIIIEISNKVGPLKSEVVTIQSGNIVPTMVIYKETAGSTPVANPFPAVDVYTGWTKTGEGATEVTYTGQKATIRASGLANTDAYEGASGPNVVFFGTLPADFVINKIKLTPEQTNLKLTFGGSYSFKPEGATDYDNTFDSSKLTVSLSADGVAWTPLAYTKNNGDTKSPYWVLATADFTLKQPTATLYIKYTALAASAFRLDDITLSTGNGGQEISFGSAPEPGEETPITIADLVNMATGAQTPVDATADRYFEAVVQNDVTGNNYSFNNLILATEGATTAGNGITLYGSQVEPTAINVKKGDKVKVTLYKGLAQAANYNGTFQVTGAQGVTWAKVEVIGTAAITPVTITADKLAEYQGMTVTIQGATTAAAGIWANNSGISPHTFTSGGTEFTVFCKKEATAFIDVPFKATTGSISGLAAVNANKGQLVPRNMEDVKEFNSTDPLIVSVAPAAVNMASTGGSQTIEVTMINQESNVLSVSGMSGILSATVSGSMVTVTAAANTTTTAVEQNLVISLAGGNSVTVPVTVKADGATSTIIALDLTNAAVYPSTFPKLTGNKKVEAETFTFDGYDYTFVGSTGNGYYQAMASGLPYIINGKQGAYIELPAIANKKLTRVSAITLAGASKSVMVGIMDASNTAVSGGTAIKWDQVDNKLDYTYDLQGTTNNTKYRIYIASGYNAQFAKLELTYE